MAAGLIKKGNVVADIGTDHGYLPVYLAKNHIASRIIAMDVRKSPLQKAIDNVKAYGVEQSVELRLSDGLDKLSPKEADTLVICGMGGKLIQTILTKGLDKIDSNTQLILSPQSEIGDFRRYLRNNGFITENEHMLKEDGKFYLILECRYIASNVALQSEKQYEQEIYDRYGKALLECKDQCLYEYLQKELALANRVYEKVSRIDQNDDTVKRLHQVEADIEYINAALQFYMTK
jgi:tRNA (adenine22-N1)-methyltransferase